MREGPQGEGSARQGTDGSQQRQGQGEEKGGSARGCTGRKNFRGFGTEVIDEVDSLISFFSVSSALAWIPAPSVFPGSTTRSTSRSYESPTHAV